MRRKAKCACGQVSAVLEGDPERVYICHCDYCQKRTGSVLAVTCYYPHDKVLELTGVTKVFSESASSIGIQYEFCPNCGTTVYWMYGEEMLRKFPDLSQYRGFAVGGFADKYFSAPQVEIQRQYAHHWIPELPVVTSFRDFGNPDDTLYQE